MISGLSIGRSELRMVLRRWLKACLTMLTNSFSSQPKSVTALRRILMTADFTFGGDEKLFVSIVKQAFNQRRKTMRNSLRPMLRPEIIDNEVFNKRPEQLSVQEFVDLTNLIG